jgi:hypothetical protein
MASQRQALRTDNRRFVGPKAGHRRLSARRAARTAAAVPAGKARRPPVLRIRFFGDA